MSKKIPLFYKMILSIILGVVLGQLAYQYQWNFLFRLAHTFNLFFTDLLKWIIPFLILSYMVPTITKITHSGSKIIFYVVLYTIISCYLGAFCSYFLGKIALPPLLNSISSQNIQNSVEIIPFFRLPLDPLLTITQVLVLSILLIIFGKLRQESPFINVLLDIQTWVKQMMKSLVLPMMPFYILSVFIKISSSGNLNTTLLSFLPIIGMIALVDVLLLLFWSTIYGLYNKTSPLVFIKQYKTPILFGFASQSSSATLPLTLETCYQNKVNPSIVEFALPLTTSINATGGTVAVIMSSLALSFINHLDTSLNFFLPFMLNVPLVIFSSVGIPGGASFVISPLLDNMLHFNPSLIGLTQTLFILQDSFSTATNITMCILITLFIEKKLSATKEATL